MPRARRRPSRPAGEEGEPGGRKPPEHPPWLAAARFILLPARAQRAPGHPASPTRRSPHASLFPRCVALPCLHSSLSRLRPAPPPRFQRSSARTGPQLRPGITPRFTRGTIAGDTTIAMPRARRRPSRPGEEGEPGGRKPPEHSPWLASARLPSARAQRAPGHPASPTRPSPQTSSFPPCVPVNSVPPCCSSSACVRVSCASCSFRALWLSVN